MAASYENKGCLTNRQIVRLVTAISANNMAAIAEGYVNIPSETFKEQEVRKQR